MKFTIAAISLACAFAAQDTTPPVISLNLDGYDKITHKAAYGNSDTVAVCKSSTNCDDTAHHNVEASNFARKCEVKTVSGDASPTAAQLTAAATNCPSPDATAYDHHDTTLTDSIVCGATQYVTSDAGKAPYKSATASACTADHKLASSAYGRRGEFVLTYDVKDASLNEAEQLIFAMVMVDTVAPTIVMDISLIQGNSKVEACLDSRNPLKATTRCKATGFSGVSASDNYDKNALSTFTYTKCTAIRDNACTSGDALAVADATIQVNIKGTGLQYVQFIAKDYADIFGTNNINNVKSELATIDVVDTTAPRLALHKYGARTATESCGTAAILDVTSLDACVEYTMTNNVPGLVDDKCAGCITTGTATLCYKAGSVSCTPATVGDVAEVIECASTIPADSKVFDSTGKAKTAGAVCVDDADSAVETGMTNAIDTLAAAVSGDDLNTGKGHDETFTYEYSCKDSQNIEATKLTRTITIKDTVAPSLAITSQSMRTLEQMTAAKAKNYAIHTGDAKACANEDSTKGKVNDVFKGAHKDATGADCQDTDSYDATVSKLTKSNADDGLADLTTVYHSAGYTQDYKLIQALTKKETGYFCDDDCAGTLNDAPTADGLKGTTVSWFKCTEANCCDAIKGTDATKYTSVTEFNTLKKGNYAIQYTCSDGVLTTTKCRNIINEDHAKPIIRILGGNDLSFEASSTTNYVDSGATCKDEIDGNISEDVEVSGDVVNLARTGVYKIYYDCKDSAENKADTATRTVTVADNTCPMCAFKKDGATDSREITLEASFPYTDPSATDVECTDELAESLTPVAKTWEEVAGIDSAVADSTFVTDSTGTYFTRYTATDATGNTNTITGATEGGFQLGEALNGNTCKFQTLSTGDDGLTNTVALAVTNDMFTRTITVEDTLKPVIKLAYDDKIIKSGTADAFGHRQQAQGKAIQTGSLPQSDEQQSKAHGPSTHLWNAPALMAEESQESVNGWVLGAIASAVSGLALLGYSLRKQAQPVATSVPV